MKIKVIWDHDNGGWYCRLRSKLGQEIDSLPPTASMYDNEDASDSDLKELAEAAAAWEGVPAPDEVEIIR